ncbi:uncharacterized protein LOC128732358 [Sabethes cyaneus]|uniref:uncharacterized protein LOC128732358 n=1 Tax=Sabethes cyaneus TaxID=53552 RepID=UPI00237DD67B|nr:uncharacterized protein LOC128732358 [Sabethes cyaneus]
MSVDVRLPTLSLPVLSGDRKQWNSFKDLYLSCIHEKRLKDSVKLQYLLSHLDGDAKKLVSAFAITDANYIQVWRKLNEYYDKKKYTVAALVKEFIEQSPVTIPSLVALRKLVTTSDEVIRQFKALGEAYENRDPWLITCFWTSFTVKRVHSGLKSLSKLKILAFLSSSLFLSEDVMH